MYLKAIITLLFITISLQVTAKPVDQNYTLFLVGGGLKTCSSQSSSNCTKQNFEQKSHKKSALYQVNDVNILRFFAAWPVEHLHKQREKMQRLLDRMAAVSDVLTKEELRQLWRKHDTASVVNQLADKEFYMMLDALEIAQINANGERTKEQVDLANTKNQYSVEIFSRFVELAAHKNKATTANKNTKPKILLVTASARDSFEAVDFYLQVFEQAGADTEWLPIDASLSAAWQSGLPLQESCSLLPRFKQTIMGTYYRQEIYPDLAAQQVNACLNKAELLNKITRADAVFINGGDQSLTLKAFVNEDDTDGPLLSVIKQQIEKKHLLVGGTSAGTAVMSGGTNFMFGGTAVVSDAEISGTAMSGAATQTVMITNGRSEAAIARGAKANQLPPEGCFKNNSCAKGLLVDDLTYNSNGGLGLFPYGVLDTHFSERGRQGRLAVLLKDTGSRFGFGVDETSALLVSNGGSKDVSTDASKDANSTQFSVIGQGGVFIIENNPVEQSDKGTKSEFITHYLTRADSAQLQDNTLNVNFADWKKQSTIKHTPDLQGDHIFEQDTYRSLNTLLCMTDAQEIKGSSVWQGNETPIKVSKTPNSRSVSGAVQTNEGIEQVCSYTNYVLTIN